MTFALKRNFFGNARGLQFEDANGITWAFNAATNQITASYTGSGSSGAANPSAKVGLTAVNGSAATFMRSDAAPPIDQTIAPTWTGQHTFSVKLALTGTSSRNTITTTGNGAYTTWRFTGKSSVGAAVDFEHGLNIAADLAFELYDSTNSQLASRYVAGGAWTLYTGGVAQLTITSGGSVTVAGRFAMNGGTPTTALSGFGSPSGAVTSGLSSSSTLAQTAGTLAALLAYLKTIGVIAA